MKKLRELAGRYGKPWLLILIGLIGWYAVGIAFEGYQASIGPEFIPKLFVKIIYIAVAMLVTRTIIRFLFPSVQDFTRSDGGTKTSKFRVEWDRLEKVQKHETVDPRVWLSLATYIGVFIGVALLLSLAAI